MLLYRGVGFPRELLPRIGPAFWGSLRRSCARDDRRFGACVSRLAALVYFEFMLIYLHSNASRRLETAYVCLSFISEHFSGAATALYFN